jgi:antirestriction protein ArdC
MNKAQDLQNQIKEGVSNLLQTDKWKAHLKFASSFYNYSFGNTLLIHSQKPEALHVAGFQTWRKLGRNVKKGERGIAILAPCQYARKKVKAEKEEADEKEVALYFTTKIVFDISQTEGEPVADVNSIYRLLDTETPDGLFNCLREYSESLGLPVSFEPMEALKGGYTDGKRIVLNETLPAAHKVKSIIHEISHNILGHMQDRKSLARDEMELEAESAAFIVSNCLGLDSSDVSFAYLASWTGGKDAAMKLLKVGQAAMKAARTILVGLGRESELEQAE